MDAVNHLLRRSRLRSFAASARHALYLESGVLDRDAENDSMPDWVIEKREMAGLDERFYASLNQYSPQELSSIEAAESTSIARATKAAAAQTTAAATTTRRAANAATHGTTINTLSRTVATSVPVYATAVSIASPSVISSAVTSSTVMRSSSLSTSIKPTSLSSSTTTSSSTARTTTSIPITSTTSVPPTVLTVTQTPTSSSTSSASSVTATNVNAAAANSSKGTSGMSTGGIVGVVVAAILGFLFLGSIAAFFYRKYASRSLARKSPWSKLDDNEITPFPPSYEKSAQETDDVYGPSTVPPIGSRRALASARENAFNPDGSLRPNSDYMIERANNRAGVGSGNLAQYDVHQEAVPGYSVDRQGRPYTPQAGRTPMLHTYQEQYSEKPHVASPPRNTRQLVGPPQPVSPHNALSPVAMGRPAAPTTMTELAQHEDFADIVEPYHVGAMLAYDNDRDGGYTPRTATTMNEWAGDARPPRGRDRVSATAPQGNTSPLDIMARSLLPRSPPRHVQMPLPTLQPLSPLLSGFDMRRSSSQPLALYENEPSQQKRMYSEVAQAAGVAEPLTPHTPRSATLNDSTSSNGSTSSFSAHEPVPRLPSLTVVPPQPYVHGRPLSPLTELATPTSVLSTRAVPSSSINHGQAEVNPFERNLIPTRLAPPYSAPSGFPSPNYPPPSPGGMSVPGSVSDSPRRWSGGHSPYSGRGESMFDGDDAYGGI